MHTNSPCIEIRVNRPSVDVIHVSASRDLAGWKLDGFKGDQLAAPDQIQDEFCWIVHELAKYVDETSIWVNLDTGQEISAWEAMMLLTKVDDEDDD
jgi:hypothetical protein